MFGSDEFFIKGSFEFLEPFPCHLFAIVFAFVSHFVGFQVVHLHVECMMSDRTVFDDVVCREECASSCRSRRTQHIPANRCKRLEPSCGNYFEFVVAAAEECAVFAGRVFYPKFLYAIAVKVDKSVLEFHILVVAIFKYWAFFVEKS